MGSQYILDSISENGKITEEARNEINQALRTHFRPEFLNRLDETICFNPLGKEQVYNIVKLMLKDLSNRLAYKDIKFNITNEAIDFIIEIGYDVNFGARPLKRTIQSEVETLVSKAIIAKEINSGDNIEVYLNKEQEELELRKI